jgi:hypothetical protein
VKMTECYDSWRKQERALKVGSQVALGADGAGTAVEEPCPYPAPAPANHTTVDHYTTHLVCGTAEVDRLVIPSYTPEGDYVVEIRDAINESIITTEAPVPAPEVVQPLEPPTTSTKPAAVSKAKSSAALAVPEPVAVVPTEPAAPVPREPRDNAAVRDKNRFATALQPSRQLKIKISKT